MSRRSFQAALSAMIREPNLAREVRAGEARRLDAFELSDVERRRLHAVARQPGMAFYGSLSRANRIEVIAEVFPETLALMGAGLRGFLDIVWSAHAPTHRLDREAALFADAMNAAIRDGRITADAVVQAFRCEQAAWRRAIARPRETRKITAAG